LRDRWLSPPEWVDEPAARDALDPESHGQQGVPDFDLGAVRPATMPGVEARRVADDAVVLGFHHERDILTSVDDLRADAHGCVINIAVDDIAKHAPHGDPVAT